MIQFSVRDVTAAVALLLIGAGAWDYGGGGLMALGIGAALFVLAMRR